MWGGNEKANHVETLILCVHNCLVLVIRQKAVAHFVVNSTLLEARDILRRLGLPGALSGVPTMTKQGV